MTLLRLDAADGEHGLAADVDHVAAEREGDDRVVGEPELAGADEDDLLVQVPLGEQGVDPGEAEWNGSATESVKISGAAPVPPSPPSMVMKSTPRPVSAIRSVSSSQKTRSPTADLMPTGKPVSSASNSTQSRRLSVSENSACREG